MGASTSLSHTLSLSHTHSLSWLHELAITAVATMRAGELFSVFLTPWSKSTYTYRNGLLLRNVAGWNLHLLTKQKQEQISRNLVRSADIAIKGAAALGFRPLLWLPRRPANCRTGRLANYLLCSKLLLLHGDSDFVPQLSASLWPNIQPNLRPNI